MPGRVVVITAPVFMLFVNRKRPALQLPLFIACTPALARIAMGPNPKKICNTHNLAGTLPAKLRL
eukprot:3938236-Rhodomonas_salina.1